MSGADLDRARLRTVRAKARLTDALATLRQRLLPRTIARNLVQGALDKGTDAVEAGADAVKTRPGVAVGIAALAALFLARKPIARAISSDPPETPSPPARSPVKRTRKAKS